MFLYKKISEFSLVFLCIKRIHIVSVCFNLTYYNWYSGNSWAIVFVVGGSGDPGRLNGSYVNSAYVVRPVVSLKKEVVVTEGDGGSSLLYQVSL